MPKRRTTKSQKPSERPARLPDAAPFQELRAIFGEVHQYGERALRAGDYKAVGDVIAVERDLIHAHRALIQAQKKAIQSRRLTVRKARKNV